MALTQGQIESFALICYNQIACQYAGYIHDVQNGLNAQDQQNQEKRFYKINSMLACIWLYNPRANNNCLTIDQVTSICYKIMSDLCFSLVLQTLPETNLNSPYDFNQYDFKFNDFA